MRLYQHFTNLSISCFYTYKAILKPDCAKTLDGGLLLRKDTGYLDASFINN